MIDLLKGYLEEWHTRQDILAYLTEKGARVTDRSFRQYVESYDRGYCDGIHDTYIAHSGKGYIITADEDIIRRSMQDDFKRAFKLLKRANGVNRRFKFTDFISLFPDDEMVDIYDLLMKVTA